MNIMMPMWTHVMRDLSPYLLSYKYRKYLTHAIRILTVNRRNPSKNGSRNTINVLEINKCHSFTHSNQASKCTRREEKIIRREKGNSKKARRGRPRIWHRTILKTRYTCELIWGRSITTTWWKANKGLCALELNPLNKLKWHELETGKR